MGKRSIESRVIYTVTALVFLTSAISFGFYVAYLEYTRRVVVDSFGEFDEVLEKERRSGVAVVNRPLRRHGLTLADNATVANDGERYTFRGSAKDSKGNVKQVSGVVRSSRFGDEINVEVMTLVVDGESVVDR